MNLLTTVTASTTTELLNYNLLLACPDPATAEVLELIELGTRAPSVLICGESGTGKEIVARALHEASDRRRGPFIEVNCGALPPTLMDDALFGHERGAFTGATEMRRGAFERAHNGTLLLDEIGEMPLDQQPRLLRVLEGHGFERLGGERQIQSDFRLIAATNRKLEELQRAGSFRPDLFHRLDTFSIDVPPLRGRPRDVPHFVRLFAGEIPIAPEAFEWATGHLWPGNVRQLKNRFERARVLSAGQEIQIRHLAREVDNISTLTCDAGFLKQLMSVGFWKAVDFVEKELLRAYLLKYGNDKRAVARNSGLRVSTLYDKLREHHLFEPRK